MYSTKMTSYLPILDSAIEFAKARLANKEAWFSKQIRYQFPHVDRLTIPWGEFRISLHYIYPCEKDKCFIHTHPWPSAIRVLSGEYETGLYNNAFFGIRKDYEPKMIISGSNGLDYEMADPNSSHYVWTPTGSYSLMLMGPKWENPIPNPVYQSEGSLSLRKEKTNYLKNLN